MAEGEPASPGKFDRDTAVLPVGDSDAGREFLATISPDWKAGLGPHGGYLAAILLRALVESVDDPQRAPRSLTIHYLRPPRAGQVQITTVLERRGRSLSSLSARMVQDGKLIAIVLAAFSVPWAGPEISELSMPDVPPPDTRREPGAQVKHGAPPFNAQLVLQPRIGGAPFTGVEQPMVSGGWIGIADPRPLDALALAFFCDALIPTPFLRTGAPAPAPTVDLTVHFRVALPRTPDPDPLELCLVQTQSQVIHEGFFAEDTTIWASDGKLLAQGRQLAILMPEAV